MKIQFAPVAPGTRWEVLLVREVNTVYRVTVDDAEIQYEYDPDDCTDLREAIKARALQILARGDGTIICAERPPAEMTHWAAAGSTAARQALDFYSQPIGGAAADTPDVSDRFQEGTQ